MPFQARTLTLTLALILVALFPSRTLAQEERDFVPGEKIVFFDDYSDMTRGASPSHWKVRGGTIKLNVDGASLQVKGEGRLLPNLTALPKSFTVQMEITKAYKIPYGEIVWRFENEQGEASWLVSYNLDVDEPDQILVSAKQGSEELAKAKLRVDYAKPLRLNFWMQDNRLRAYLDDARALDVNQLELKPWKRVVVEYNLTHAEEPFLFGPVRIAESTPDVSQMLISTGKFVSHGIQFETNSDKVRPDTVNVLKEVVAALRTQPKMKLRIEGHTDSTGDPAKNLELSKRRAAAVKSTIVAFGIDPSRLAAEGFGQTKPASSNDTIQGRAENRRVEFIAGS